MTAWKRAITTAACVGALLVAIGTTDDAHAVILQIDPAESVARSIKWDGEKQDTVEFPLSGKLRLTVTAIPKGQWLFPDRIDFMNIDANTDNGSGRSWAFPADAAEFRPPNLTIASCGSFSAAICPAMAILNGPTFSGTYDGNTLHLAGPTEEPEAPRVPPLTPSGWSYSASSYTLVAHRVSTLTVTSDPSVKKPAKFNINGGKGVFRVVFEDAETPSDVVPVIVSSGKDWITFTKAPTVAQLVNGKAVVEIAYTVAKNPAAARRQATLTVNGTPVLQLEQAGAPCKVNLSSSQTSFEYFGGTSKVTYSVREGCAVVATTDDSWLTLIPGDGEVKVATGETSKARTGKVNVVATHPETGVTDRKVLTIVQKKRSGAGTVKLNKYSEIDTADKAAKAADAALFIFNETLDVGQAFMEISGAMAEPSDSPARIFAKSAKMIERLLSSPAPQGAYSRHDCQVSGSKTWSRSGTAVTYDHCREGGMEVDGTISSTGFYNSKAGRGHGKSVLGTGTSSPFTVITFLDDAYEEKTESLSFAVTVVSDVSENVAEGKPRGGARYNGYIDRWVAGRNGSGLKTLLDMQNFRISSYRFDGWGQIEIDGSLRATSIANGSVRKVQEVAVKDLMLSNHPEGQSLNVSLDGSFAINSYPDDSCIDGTFTVSTVTPMSYSQQDGVRYGEITINGVSVAVDQEGAGTATIGGIQYPLGQIGSQCIP